MRGVEVSPCERRPSFMDARSPENTVSVAVRKPLQES